MVFGIILINKTWIKKRKSVYAETYKKGTFFNNLEDIYNALKQKEVIVYLIKAEQYDDGTESMTIKIDKIKP